MDGRGGAWTVGETRRCVSGGCHLSLHCPHGPRPRTRVSPRVHLCSAASGLTRPPVPLDEASSPPPPSPRPRRGVRSRRTHGGTTRPARTNSPARQVVGGFPPHHPDNRCSRRYSSLSWACALGFGAGSPAAPAQWGRRHLPRHPRDRQTHTRTHSPRTAPLPSARGAEARALGDSPAPR